MGEQPAPGGFMVGATGLDPAPEGAGVIGLVEVGELVDDEVVDDMWRGIAIRQ